MPVSNLQYIVIQARSSRINHAIEHRQTTCIDRMSQLLHLRPSQRISASSVASSDSLSDVPLEEVRCTSDICKNLRIPYIEAIEIVHAGCERNLFSKMRGYHRYSKTEKRKHNVQDSNSNLDPLLRRKKTKLACRNGFVFYNSDLSSTFSHFLDHKHHPCRARF